MYYELLLETPCRDTQQGAEWEFRSNWVAVITWELDGGTDVCLRLEFTGIVTWSHLTDWLWSGPSQIPATLPNLEDRWKEPPLTPE